MKNPGEKVSHYKIISVIGSGGMGEVYLAHDTKLDRKVAIKFLHDEPTKDSHRPDRFIQEGKVVSALNHPNILTVYEIGKTGSTSYIVTEYIEGRTLRQYLSRHKPLQLNQALKIAVQIAEALSAAHQAGIIHRDIKPENIMVRNDGVVKVLDFGLAKLTHGAERIDSEADTNELIVTTSGIVMGTSQYMSPEQARGQTVDARSDIWSFGVVLFEMLTGQLPFKGESVNDVIAAVLKNDPLPLSAFAADHPAEMQRIITKSLQKKSDERYQGIRDLALDLRSLRKELESSARMTNSSNASAGHLTGEGKFHTLATVRRFSLVHELLILLFTLFVAGGVWWFFVRGGAVNVSAPDLLKTSEIIGWNSLPGELDSIGSFSPDGRMIAFPSTKSGTKNIWVKQTAAGEAIQITNDNFGNDYPVWSPDGNEIAFLSQRGDHAGIWRIPSLGGAPTLIKSVQGSDTALRRWSINNTIYYEHDQNMFALDIKTGQASQLTSSDPNVRAGSLNVSPDGGRVSFVTNENEQCSVWVLDIRVGSAKQLFTGASEIINTVWHPDNRRLLFSSKLSSNYQIFVTDIDGIKPTQITFGDNNYMALDVSKDGSAILFGSSKEESDIWTTNVVKNEEFPVAADAGSELWPDVSPDNKTIAYQAVKKLNQGNEIRDGVIFIKQVGSKEPPVQISPKGFLPIWSPDGNSLAFMRYEGPTSGIWVNNPTGGEEKQLTKDGILTPDFMALPYDRDQISYLDWSPDGSKIAYLSDRSSLENVWIVSVDGSKDEQVTNTTGADQSISCPIWASDGKQLAYASRQTSNGQSGSDFALWILDTETKDSKLIFRSKDLIRLLGWSQTDNELLFAEIKGKTTKGLPPELDLVQISINTGARHLIATLESAYLLNIHLSRDRRTFAFAARRENNDNVWVLPITGGEARRLTDNKDPKIYFSSLAWSPDGRTVFYGKQSRLSLLSMITNFK